MNLFVPTFSLLDPQKDSTRDETLSEDQGLDILCRLPYKYTFGGGEETQLPLLLKTFDARLIPSGQCPPSSCF